MYAIKDLVSGDYVRVSRYDHQMVQPSPYNTDNLSVRLFNKNEIRNAKTQRSRLHNKWNKLMGGTVNLVVVPVNIIETGPAIS